MNLLTPFLIGLFSSVHCLLMCGGLCGLFSQQQNKLSAILTINFGRILTYTLLGLIFAGIIQGFALRIPVGQIGFWIRSLLGLVFIFLGIKVILNNSNLPTFFKNTFLWGKAQKQLHALIRNHSFFANISKGILWGMIPCGLLYGVLIAASATQNTLSGGLFMLAFGIGTLPSMLVSTGLFNAWKKKAQSKLLRYSAGSFIVIIGLWTMISPWISQNFLPQHPVFTEISAFLDSCAP